MKKLQNNTAFILHNVILHYSTSSIVRFMGVRNRAILQLSLQLNFGAIATQWV